MRGVTLFINRACVQGPAKTHVYQSIQFRPVRGRDSHKNRVVRLKKSVFQLSEVVLSSTSSDDEYTERELGSGIAGIGVPNASVEP